MTDEGIKITITVRKPGIAGDAIGRTWLTTTALYKAARQLDHSGPVRGDWRDTLAAIVGRALETDDAD